MSAETDYQSLQDSADASNILAGGREPPSTSSLSSVVGEKQTESESKPRFRLGYGESVFHRQGSSSSLTEPQTLHRQVSASSMYSDTDAPAPIDSAKSNVSFENNYNRARSVSASVGSNIQSFITKTKDFLFDSNETASTPDTRFGNSEPSYDYNEGNFALQQRIPVVEAEIISFDQVDRRFYSVIEVSVPYGVGSGDSFTVALPTGENRTVMIPLHHANFDKITLCFRADKEEEEYSKETETEEESTQSDEKLLELYRIHRPVEREAILLRGKFGFGLTVYDGAYGVHVHSATFSGLETMLMADDIITNVNGQPINKKQELIDVFVTEDLSEIGAAVTLGILRKSPSLTQKCPQGQDLIKIGLRDDLWKNDLHCRKCDLAVWNSTKTAYTCPDCLWTLCEECFTVLNNNLNSDTNANEIPPDWADDFEEALGLTLEMGPGDIGKKIRIYWHSTGEWWLGEISDYNQEHGHTIVYPEGDKLSKEVIARIDQYHYRVLKSKS